jgi:hypothetical protein
MKIFAPAILLVAVACHSSDGTAPQGPPSDISSMSVDEGCDVCRGAYLRVEGAVDSSTGSSRMLAY